VDAGGQTKLGHASWLSADHTAAASAQSEAGNVGSVHAV
jgi:hypothetical protein